MIGMQPLIDKDCVARYRMEFPVTKNHVYMNHAGVAPTSLRVCRAVTEWMEALANHGVALNHGEALEEWEKRAALCRERFANLIGCLPREVAFVRNTSHGLALVAEGLKWREGDRIAVAKEVEYPSNVHVWEHVAKSRRLIVDKVVPDGGAVTVDAVAKVLRPRRTRLVAVSSAQFGTGAVTDLVALAQLCRDQNVLLCVDGIQTVGAFPIDVKKLGIPFLAADSHKWMLGMMGIGALYVDESLIEGMRPALVGWKSMVDGWSFVTGLSGKLLSDAKRFEEGSPTYAMIEGFSAALELLQEVSVEAISRRLSVLTDRLARGLEQLDCSVGPKPEHRHHIVSFTHTALREPEDFRVRLMERRIVVTARGGAVRVSPHFYNTEQEIDELIEAVGEIVSEARKEP